jgi:tetratricopeptide (TPR) repeat protein
MVTDYQLKSNSRYSSIAIVLLLFTLLQDAPASDCDFPAPGDIEVIRGIVDAGFREDYQRADSLAISLQNRYPYCPIGYVMHAAMLHSRMLDDEHFEYESQFNELIDLTVSKAEAIIDSESADAWTYYCLGLAHGSKAVFDARKGSKWSALKRGMKSKSAFSKSIELDSTFYDSYVGLGSYHYWRTVKTKLINWLPLVQDDREEGIRELQLAINQSLFSSDFATNALIWVYIDAERFAAAESLAVSMQSEYPEGRKFLWAIAAASLPLGDTSGAEAAYFELLKKTREKTERSGYNEFECLYYLSKIQYEQGRFEQCASLCDSALATGLSQYAKERLNGKLRELRDLRARAPQNQ